MQKLPYLLRLKRHINLPHSQWSKRIQHRVDNSRRSSNAARLANAFCTQWIERRRRLNEIGNKFRYLRRNRQSVIHQSTCQKLPVRIVQNFLKECLSNTLGETAMYLGFGQVVIKYAPAVVHSYIFQDMYFTGFSFYLDHCY